MAFIEQHPMRAKNGKNLLVLFVHLNGGMSVNLQVLGARELQFTLWQMLLKCAIKGPDVEVGENRAPPVVPR